MVRRMWRLAGVATVAILVMTGIIYAKRRADYKEREAAPPIWEFKCDAAGNPICPHCGRTDKVMECSYGLRGDGKASMCVISPDSPEYKCFACGTSFGRSQMAQAIMRMQAELEAKEQRPAVVPAPAQ